MFFYFAVSQDISGNQTDKMGVHFTEYDEPIYGSSSKPARRRENRIVPGTGEFFFLNFGKSPKDFHFV